MIKVNGELKNLDSISLLDYLNNNGYNVKVVAVELNGEIIKKSEYVNTCVHDGDSVEIVSFVGGG